MKVLIYKFPKTNPISPAGELLKFAVGQADDNEPDYSELLDDEDWTSGKKRKIVKMIFKALLSKLMKKLVMTQYELIQNV